MKKIRQWWKRLTHTCTPPIVSQQVIWRCRECNTWWKTYWVGTHTDKPNGGYSMWFGWEWEKV